MKPTGMLSAAGESQPSLRALRVAVDKTRLLYEQGIPPTVWERLVTDSTFTIDTPGEPLVFERKGVVDAEATRMEWLAQGAWVRMHRADVANRLVGKASLDLEVHGLACSSSRDGLAAIEAIRLALERFVWMGAPLPAGDPGVGVTDLCADIEVAGNVKSASEWIERDIYRSGNIDRIVAAFSTRARKESIRVTSTSLGSVVKGRTAYLGSAPRLMIYEKDKHTRARDLPLVHERWREQGWDGESRVVRIEMRVTREWLAKNEIVLDGHPRTDPNRAIPLGEEHEPTIRLAGPSGLSWTGMVEWLPTLFRELLGRFRMTDRHDPAKRVSRRRTAPFWRAALDGVDHWDHRLSREYGVAPEDWAAGEIMALARRYSKDRAERRLERAAVDWHTSLAHDEPDVSLPTAVAIVADHVLRAETRTATEALDQARELRIRRLNLRRSEHGYHGKPPPERPPMPPPVADERNRTLELLLPLLEQFEGTAAGDRLAEAMRAIEQGTRPAAAPEPPPEDLGPIVHPPVTPPPTPRTPPKAGDFAVPEYPPDPWYERKRRR